jgi:hypothetical protein
MIGSAHDIIELYDSEKAKRGTWDTHWQRLAEMVMPQQATHASQTTETNLTRHLQLYDSSGVDYLNIHVRGTSTQITPKSAQWFEFGPGDGLEDDDAAKQWLSKATERIWTAINRSNFSTEHTSSLYDRVGLGTGALFLGVDDEGGFNFEYLSLGTFVCLENAKGRVDVVIRSKSLTARQAADEYGEDNLPDDVRKMLTAGEEKAQERSEYLHAIFPRRLDSRPALHGMPTGRHMAVASIHVHKDAKMIVRDSGAPDMPIFVSRFQRVAAMPGAQSRPPWGWCPTAHSYGDLKQLQFLERIMDALAERQVNPPVIMPSDYAGRVDWSPGGVTFEDRDSPNTTREWMTQGRYDVGAARGDHKRARVRSAFMVDLFQQFAQMDANGRPPQMTATEIMSREREKLDQFISPHELHSGEMLEPMLKLAFTLLLRRGGLGRVEEIPQQLLVENPRSGMLDFLEPKVQFTSRLARAVQQAQLGGTYQSFEMIAQLAQFRPEVLDNLDFDRMARDTMRANGADPDHLTNERLRDVQRQIQAQVTAEQAAMQGEQAA